MPALPPTGARVLQYIAARITAVERQQESIESYYSLGALDPTAKTKLEEAYTLYEAVQLKLIDAMSAQAQA